MAYHFVFILYAMQPCLKLLECMNYMREFNQHADMYIKYVEKLFQALGKDYRISQHSLYPPPPPSHRRRGATTVFGQNRHHRRDTASSFS